MLDDHFVNHGGDWQALRPLRALAARSLGIVPAAALLGKMYFVLRTTTRAAPLDEAVKLLHAAVQRSDALLWSAWLACSAELAAGRVGQRRGRACVAAP